MKFKSFIDLYAGIGAFRLALSEKGLECVFSSEWDKDCRDVYENNFGSRPCGDIEKIDSGEIPSHDVLCGGFPCQPFSISGKREGFLDKEGRGVQFFEITRIVEKHRPKLIFLENVRNFLGHDGGKTMGKVKSELVSLGYDVYYKVLNSADFGVAQQRRRIFILGFRRDLEIDDFEFPKFYFQKRRLRDDLSLQNLDSLWIEREDIFLDINKIKEIEKVNLSELPYCPIRVGFLNKGGQGERIYHPNGVAVTLSAFGGGAGAKTGLYYDRGKIRRLSPCECARIMSFPKNFKLHENKNVAYRQFGNSIVVNVLRAIFEKVLETSKK